jgi:hypothetical protein
VGLAAHLEPGHRCPEGATCRVDYHGPGGTGAHPEDFISGCPARYHDPALSAAIYQAIEIEDLGGLSVYSGRPVALLPASTVALYRGAIAARDRFQALLSEAERECERRSR